MTKPFIPLPTDEELSEKEFKLLKGIPDANIFRAVANTTASLKPFLEFAGSILLQSKFDRRLRELAILRIATITSSKYEWVQHERIGRIVGLSDDEIARVSVDGPVRGFTRRRSWSSTPLRTSHSTSDCAMTCWRRYSIATAACRPPSWSCASAISTS